MFYINTIKKLDKSRYGKFFPHDFIEALPKKIIKVCKNNSLFKIYLKNNTALAEIIPLLCNIMQHTYVY